MTTGSALTVAVVGPYWMISASSRAPDDDALGDGDRLPRLVSLFGVAPFPPRQASDVGRVIDRSPNEIDPVLAQGLFQRDRVRQKKIRRRHSVQRLAADEIEHRQMMACRPVNLRGGFVPATLRREEGVGVKRKWPVLPFLGAETAVLGAFRPG